jgi:hypothetical protein
VLRNLKSLKENPPSLHVSVYTEDESSIGEALKSHGSIEQIDSNIPAEDIDWDISVDANEIDWDIGAVEQPVEEAANGFGSYEIIDANIELAGSENYDISVSDNPSLNKEGLASSESGIRWDITADNSEESVCDKTNIQNALMVAEDRSRLLDKEYRNEILDDLLEVCLDHFLNPSRFEVFSCL